MSLHRLRDMTQETEQEQRRRIAEMEKDVTSLDDIQGTSFTYDHAHQSHHFNLIGQYESTLIKLTNAEQQVEDLKLQLDDAFSAEEMLVQLTERNLMLGEVHLILSYLLYGIHGSHSVQKIEEMRITIEDLEALKELSDELEENHIETEKQLNEDLSKNRSRLGIRVCS